MSAAAEKAASGLIIFFLVLGIPLIRKAFFFSFPSLSFLTVVLRWCHGIAEVSERGCWLQLCRDGKQGQWSTLQFAKGALYQGSSYLGGRSCETSKSPFGPLENVGGMFSIRISEINDKLLVKGREGRDCQDAAHTSLGVALISTQLSFGQFFSY